MTSLIGRRIGRYEIRAELGRGGMARVYRAVDTLLQRQVALKVLAAQLSMDEEFVQRFKREATTAANLHHPAIVTIYDIGEEDGLHYIAMEYIAGRSLHAILEEQRTLGLGYAVSLLDPVARALDYAHGQGSVHRDIKPHNILIGLDGRVVLTDFGIAQTSESNRNRLTRTGIFMGTPEYISPEQAESQRVDGRSDLYGLGIVAYEIITGRVPFAGSTPQLIVAHAQLPPPPPTSVLAYLPPDLDDLMLQALAKHPDQRYPSGTALVTALRNVALRYGIPIATRDQLAALATAAGELPLPPPPPPVERGSAPRVNRAPRSSEPVAPPAAQASASLRLPSGTVPPRSATFPSPPKADSFNSGGQWPMLVIGTLLVILTLSLLFVVTRGLAEPVRPVPTVTQPPEVPSLTPTLAESAIPATTETLPPTPVPIAITPILVVPTPPPPTPSQVPIVATSVPTVVPTRTPTALPTSTPTETSRPTESPTITLTPTLTLTPTATQTPSPTVTPEPTAIFGTPIIVTPIVP